MNRSFEGENRTQPEGYAIRVHPRPQYIAEQSAPEQHRFVFAYTITIENRGEKSAQLVSRHWYITNGEGEVSEVQGPGVVGETPILEPGELYTYTSGAVLETPVGTMHGSYQMRGEDGTRFEAAIPTFALVMPQMLH
ncbi:MAG: Co2+/Mg2+ efflux protein ApaG [Gammaproteobacteria bacterium]|nr:Co2+/Mg2+ efflux protein ApaG [Gammaproteobacteria bacterium]